MPARHLHSDLAGRVLAYLVLLAGVGLLAWVFMIALDLFRSAVPGLPLPVKHGAEAPPAMNIAGPIITFLERLLLLFLMTFAGSLIASKGVQMYFGTHHSVHHAGEIAVTHPAAPVSPAPPSVQAEAPPAQANPPSGPVAKPRG